MRSRVSLLAPEAQDIATSLQFLLVLFPGSWFAAFHAATRSHPEPLAPHLLWAATWGQSVNRGESRRVRTMPYPRVAQNHAAIHRLTPDSPLDDAADQLSPANHSSPTPAYLGSGGRGGMTPAVFSPFPVCLRSRYAQLYALPSKLGPSRIWLHFAGRSGVPTRLQNQIVHSP